MRHNVLSHVLLQIVIQVPMSMLDSLHLRVLLKVSLSQNVKTGLYDICFIAGLMISAQMITSVAGYSMRMGCKNMYLCVNFFWNS